MSREKRVAAAAQKMEDLGWCPGEWETPTAFDAEIGLMLEAADAAGDRSRDFRDGFRTGWRAAKDQITEAVSVVDLPDTEGDAP